VKQLEARIPSLAVAVAIAVLAIATIYLVFKLIGFAVWPFETWWVIAPTTSFFVFLLVANWDANGSFREVAISHANNRSNLRIVAIFLAAFLVWGLARTIGDWAVGTNYIDHGACSHFGFDDGLPCGTEDLNAPSQAAVGDLVDKFASAFFILSPFALLHSKARSLIGVQ
jgi:hypothetical protein